MVKRTRRPNNNKNDDDEITGRGPSRFTSDVAAAEKYQDMGIHITETVDTIDDEIVEEEVEVCYDSSSYDSSSRRNNEQQTTTTTKKKKKTTKKSSSSCTLGSCLFLTVCIGCIVAGLAIGISFFVLGTPNPFEFFKSNNQGDELNINDQWETTSSTTGEKGGLDLVIENAVDDNWIPILEEYVDKWNNGEPDSLSLTMKRVKVDTTCKPSFGRLKVCNGDYGETTWEGLNLSLVQEGYIRWSTARMNDYFLKNENDVTKRYTMCHELGHGFGLAHSDEEYYNKNRGDCMDYTHRPHGNLSPGKVNWETLEKVYGSSSSRRRQRLLRKRKRSLLEIPQHIIDEYFSIEEKEYLSSEEGSYVVDLGDGFHVVVNKMPVIKR